MSAPPFTRYSSATGKTTPLVIDFPHSGDVYPDDFGYACNKNTLALCEEMYLDEIFVPSLIAIGGMALKANFPRTYVDANRAENDIDNLLLDAPWPEPCPPNGRSIHGHGVVMRMIRAGEEIYNAPLAHADIQKRITEYYRPYHSSLRSMLEDIYAQHGVVYHLNMHSMPSSVVNASFPHAPPDFILGDCDGRSCGVEFRNLISETLRGMGYRVVINQLYKGAEIVKRYGNSSWGYHSLQIEINRALFQDEVGGKNNKNFNTLVGDMNKLVLSIKDFIKI